MIRILDMQLCVSDLPIIGQVVVCLDLLVNRAELRELCQQRILPCFLTLFQSRKLALDLLDCISPSA